MDWLCKVPRGKHCGQEKRCVQWPRGKWPWFLRGVYRKPEAGVEGKGDSGPRAAGEVGVAQIIHGFRGPCWSLGFSSKCKEKPIKVSEKVGITGFFRNGFFWQCVLVGWISWKPFPKPECDNRFCRAAGEVWMWGGDGRGKTETLFWW